MPTKEELIKTMLANPKPANVVPTPVKVVVKIPELKVEEKNNYNTTDGKPPRYVGGNLQPINGKM